MTEDPLVRMAEVFLQKHPQDAARTLETQPPEQVADVLLGSRPDTAAKVAQHMAPAAVAACLAPADADASAAVLARLPINALAPVLRLFSPQRLAQALKALPKPVVAALQPGLAQAPGTVGALMDPTAAAYPADLTAEKLRRMIQTAAQGSVPQVYLVDRAHKLVGVLDPDEVLRAPDAQPVGAIMRRAVTKLNVSTPLARVAARPDLNHTAAYPVVDKAGTFLGVLTARVLRAAAGKADPKASAPTTATDTLVAFGELYWVTLSGMLSGQPGQLSQGPANAQPRPPAEASPQTTEARDGN